MTSIELFNSVYLGDRRCKSLEVDGTCDELRIAVDLISRIRGEAWNFYDAEDIENGCLVFEGVKRVTFDPSGPVPNAWIDPISVVPCGESTYEFQFSLGSVDEKAKSTEVVLTVVATSMALQDKNGVRIRE